MTVAPSAPAEADAEPVRCPFLREGRSGAAICCAGERPRLIAPQHRLAVCRHERYRLCSRYSPTAQERAWTGSRSHTRIARAGLVAMVLAVCAATAALPFVGNPLAAEPEIPSGSVTATPPASPASAPVSRRADPSGRWHARIVRPGAVAVTER
jgi:hypothetical protein